MPNPFKGYAGSASCMDCHERFYKLWSTSRHGLAMQPYTADFACIEARLVVELDGGQHGGAADAPRDTKLVAMGWLVKRYWNSDVTTILDGFVTVIVACVIERMTRKG
jgi:very-short-patch-repair endonuclease